MNKVIKDGCDLERKYRRLFNLFMVKINFMYGQMCGKISEGDFTSSFKTAKINTAA